MVATEELLRLQTAESHHDTRSLEVPSMYGILEVENLIQLPIVVATESSHYLDRILNNTIYTETR